MNWAVQHTASSSDWCLRGMAQPVLAGAGGFCTGTVLEVPSSCPERLSACTAT